MGGMFEVGVGRAQARVLASLFTSRGWNDLAPVVRQPAALRPTSPLAVSGEFAGFAPGPYSSAAVPPSRRRYSRSHAAGRLSRGE